MSTKERYFSLVANAVIELSYLVDAQVYCFITVGEVAASAGVSRMTARKYLNVAVDEGHMAKMMVSKNVIYRMLVKSED